MRTVVAALGGVLLLAGCAAPDEPSSTAQPAPRAVASKGQSAAPVAAASEAPPSPAAMTMQCQAAMYAAKAEPLFGRLLVAVNELDDAAAMSVVGDYVSQGEFIGEAAFAMCRSPGTSPNENICRNFTAAGIDLLRKNIAAWQSIDEASQAGARYEDVDSAHEALEQANESAGTASAVLEGSYC
jgi:hypothetical protein